MAFYDGSSLSPRKMVHGVGTEWVDDARPTDKISVVPVPTGPNPWLGRPPASSERVRRQMSQQRTRDTDAELAIRRRLHARGFRYRVDYAVVPGLRRRADIAFTRARVAVFIDGCFWHGCPEHRTYPKANREWWGAKLAGNVDRDRQTDQRLREAGWRVVRIWEHEDPAVAVKRVLTALKSAGDS